MIEIGSAVYCALGEFKMGRICAVVNQKGGVGKTTTVINLAAYLALMGQRVLVVDLDPQGNATSGLGADKNEYGHNRNSDKPSTYDVLINDVSVADAVIETPVERLFLVPANVDLAGAEQELIARIARETVLQRALAPVSNDYDFIFIDSPPSLGLLTVNALTVANGVIVPIQCEYFALEGVSELIRTVDLVRKHLNTTLKIDMVILTMFDSRSNSAKQVVQEVITAFGPLVAKSAVPRNVRLAEAPSHGLPIAMYDARSRGAIAYKEIAQEVLQGAKERSR